MSRIVIEHGTESWEVVEKISAELASFGLVIEIVKEDVGKFLEYEIRVLK